MGHRHLLGSRENRNVVHEQSYMHLGRAGTSNDRAIAFHRESTEGVNGPFNRNSIEWSSSFHMELPYRHVPISSSSYDPFRQPSSTRHSCRYANSSSSSHGGHVVCETEAGLIDSTVGNASSSYKRKRTAAAVAYERGSMSTNSSTGRFSDCSIASSLQTNLVPQHWPQEIVRMAPGNRGATLSIPGEGFQRNVRSRYAHELDVNLTRINNASYHAPPNGGLVYHPGTVLDAGTERNRMHVSSVTPRRNVVSETNGYRRDTVQLGARSSGVAYPVDGRLDLINRSLTTQNLQVPITQTVRGQSSYPQRAVPAFRATHGYHPFGHAAVSPETALLSAPEIYPSSHFRPLPAVGWHTGERSERSGIRYRGPYLLPGAVDANDRLATEDFVMVGTSSWYNSPDLFDQHRGMRLEIDDMSYEELLALEDRIGNVNTGISKDWMSKCLRETTYSSSKQIQEEIKCVICLEEYENTDVVATLTMCCHSYHSGCIKKWLSTKNMCPVCKAPALAHS